MQLKINELYLILLFNQQVKSCFDIFSKPHSIIILTGDIILSIFSKLFGSNSGEIQQLKNEIETYQKKDDE